MTAQRFQCLIYFHTNFVIFWIKEKLFGKVISLAKSGLVLV